MNPKDTEPMLCGEGSSRGVKIPDLPKLRILLAEDNPVNQTFAILILKRYGHNVVAVANGQQAIQELETNDYDVVLMDIRMPILSGDDALEDIRGGRTSARDPEIPVIAMTAHTGSDEIQHFEDVGFDGFIGKPMTWEIVLSTIHMVLERKGRLEDSTEH